jgi:hypothetical protein
MYIYIYIYRERQAFKACKREACRARACGLGRGPCLGRCTSRTFIERITCCTFPGRKVGHWSSLGQSPRLEVKAAAPKGDMHQMAMHVSTQAFIPGLRILPSRSVRILAKRPEKVLFTVVLRKLVVYRSLHHCPSWPHHTTGLSWSH